jgi:hypothetical protein
MNGMREQRMAVSGGAIWWTVCEYYDRSSLLTNLTYRGLEKYCPEPRTPVACLKDALRGVFADKRHSVDCIKSKDGYAVYEETAHEHRVDRKHIVTAKIDASCAISFYGEYGGASYTDKAQGILDEYNRYAGMLISTQVSTCMVHIISQHFAGLCLKPGIGGLYWLPDDKLEDWRNVSEAVEASANLVGKAGNRHVSSMIRSAQDEDSFKSVANALIAEVQAEAARLNREINDEDIGARALENRREEAVALRLRVKQFEDLLGCRLNELEAVADNVEVAAAQAVMLASARAVA